MADVKQDWADEIARLLGCAACGDIETAEIATALRKAKADGVKEASEICEATGQPKLGAGGQPISAVIRKSNADGMRQAAEMVYGSLAEAPYAREDDNLRNIESAIRAAAAKIEKGESNG